MPTKIIIALSGGVDSAVAAILLKQHHSNLQAVFMRNWDAELNNDNYGKKANNCTDHTELEAVQNICKQLDIPLKIYNFVSEYWDQVFQPGLDELKFGIIPNFDINCNKKIKFGALLQSVINDFGPDIKLATGHYAQTHYNNNFWHLGTAVNKQKDQSYFLYSLTQEQLAYLIFPLANIPDKSIVRQIAKIYKLPIWNKSDSTGICFIGKRPFSQFMQNYLPSTKKDIYLISNNKKIGSYEGASTLTIGQRKGLAISGNFSPLFVCKKNYKNNNIYLCTNEDKTKYLGITETRIIKMYWTFKAPKIGDNIFLRNRHLGLLFSAIVIAIDDQEACFRHNLVIATNPGQSIVCYDNTQTECLGGGIYFNKELVIYD